MRRPAVAAVAAIPLALFACSDASKPPPLGGDAAPPTNDAATKDVAVDAPKEAAAEGGADAGPDVAAPTFVDVADTPCQSLAADAGAVLVQAPGAPRFVDLGAVSTRRFAASEDQLVAFDTTGANATAPFAPPFIDYVTASGEGSTIAVASLNSGAVGFTRYDATGTMTLATQTVQATTPAGDPALAIGSRMGASLIVWRQGTNLRGVEYGATLGTAVDFGANTFGTAVDVAIGWSSSASSYAIAWTGDPGDGTYRLRFTVWGNTQTVTTSYEQTAPMHVVRLVPAASGTGWAALVNSDYPSQAVYLVPLDAGGAVNDSVRRYLGAAYAWSLASSATGYAMVARRATDEPEWRSLTTSGDGQSSWVCLAGSLGNQIGGCGVDADGARWATVYSTENGGASFVSLDSSGSP